MARPVCCKQTGLLLTKDKYLFYYKMDLYFNDLDLNDFILNFSVWIYTFSLSHKMGATTVAWSQIFLYENCKHTDFLNQ